MATYKMNFDATTSVLSVGFADPASNDIIVKEVASLLPSIAAEVAGTKCLRLNGPASLPVAVELAHGLVHVVAAIAVFDPKIGGYVVAVSHDPAYRVGDIIPA